MLCKKSVLALSLLALPLLAAAGPAVPPTGGGGSAGAPGVVFPEILPGAPSDIPGGAPNATLQAASIFAWQEFIGLSWPSTILRGFPDPFGRFGQTYGPTVWETMRGKVETYPGVGVPHGHGNLYFGYSDPPLYIYSPAAKPNSVDDPGVGGPYAGLRSGEVPACFGQAPVARPAWINLDESSQIGFDTMYAGNGPSGGDVGQQVLFMAKADSSEWNYVDNNSWYDGTTVLPIEKATAIYVNTNKQSPIQGSTNYVSFLYGTIEVKAAMRQLTAQEAASGRFITATARYYLPQDPAHTYGGQPGQSRYPCWREGTFGLLALHIIQKTPSAPYFIFATFGQADNLLDAHGNPVEDDNGNLTGNGAAAPLTPTITSQNATNANPPTPGSIQHLSPAQANCTPGSELYYRNTPGTPLPQGNVCVNRRINSIPADVIAVNQAAHQAISAYIQGPSPYLHYKLVNVQYKPIDKPLPGTTYTGADAATYYQSNIVVETDFNLQRFSGRLQPNLTQPNSPSVANLITDFYQGQPVHNVAALGTAYNMGGCMGCHGNAQSIVGSDFSFILAGQRVYQPDLAGPQGQGKAAARFQTFLEEVLLKNH